MPCTGSFKNTRPLWTNSPHLTYVLLLIGYTFTANLMSYISSHQASRRQAKGSMIKEGSGSTAPLSGAMPPQARGLATCPWRSHSLIVASSSLSTVSPLHLKQRRSCGRHSEFSHTAHWSKTMTLKFPRRQNCICFQNCLHSLFFLPCKKKKAIFTSKLKIEQTGYFWET